MSELSKIGESLIDEAIASGALQPPPAGTQTDHESYFATPVEWRASFSILKGNGFTPPEIEWLRQAERLESELVDCTDPQERLRLRREIAERRAGFQMALERSRGRP
ncbi:hypothetical protein HNR46_001810 [Haloferula luteola]|uniref:DnaJ homologue subfamily C member 28 conserved domain-containing protein n=1 Tax=Haloferula luteola TaxID=595692 RepID=A0A840V2A1_9BACT|nr:DUF1992 domain-containing protein [Haloferula luteola]MBB5351573.1 hypothetical protein [Haloferula luteola]